MWVRLAIALVFVLALSTLAADFTIGCGQPYVYGIVSQKYARTGENDVWRLQIGSESWGVPEAFWYQAKLGDTVKFDGVRWSIVKSVGTTWK